MVFGPNLSRLTGRRGPVVSTVRLQRLDQQLKDAVDDDLNVLLCRAVRRTDVVLTQQTRTRR